MQAQQKAVVDWMREVMDRRKLSARAWAEKASLGKDTVSRALRPDYGHVTTTTTLAKLAEAVGERAPGLAPTPPIVPVTGHQIMMPVTFPNEAALARMFEGLLRAMDRAAPLDEQARLLAQRLPIGLSQLRDLLPAAPAAAEPTPAPSLATPAPAPR